MIQYYIEYTSGINFTNLFSFLNVTIRKCKIGEREMAQRIKAHVVQPDNMVERENWPHRLSSSLHMGSMAYKCTYTQMYKRM